MKKILLFPIMLLAPALVVATVPATAQDFPTRAITMIVPFPAGGPSDVVARIMAEGMSKHLGQNVVIENVGGAGGTTGTARLFESSSHVEALAASVPDSGGVYFVPAFAGLGAPHWDPHARGTIVGLTRGTTRAHVARAALEGIAFQSAELLEAMQKDAARPLIELRVDGGATANNLLMQFQTDLLGVPVVRPRITETTALGAACLAGLGAGFWSSLDELSGNWQVDRRFEPRMSRDEATNRLRRWSDAVDRSRRWAEGV